MNKQELKALHPELSAELIADGVAQERDRTNAHLALAKRSGEMALALESIASGEGLTGAIVDKHVDARMGRLETRERQLDSDEAGAILDGATNTADGGKDIGDEVADRIEAMFGKKSTVSA